MNVEDCGTVGPKSSTPYSSPQTEPSSPWELSLSECLRVLALGICVSTLEPTGETHGDSLCLFHQAPKPRQLAARLEQLYGGF